MTRLSRASYATRFNDATNGLYKAGQIGSISSAYHREMIEHNRDSPLWPEDCRQAAAMSVDPLPDYTYDPDTDTITATADGALEIDGVEVQDGDIVLINAEGDATLNGVWAVTQAGDVDDPFILGRQTQGSFNEIFFVAAGDTNEGKVVFLSEALHTSFKEKEKFFLLPSVAVLGLNSTPVDIVAAPGADKVVIPTEIGFYMAYGSTPYATNTTIVLRYGDGTEIFVDASDFLASTGDRVVWYTIPTVDGVINEPIQIYVQDGDPTDGDSTVRLIIKYRTISL